MSRVARKRVEPRKKPRQERSRETVAAILAAAARVFATAGYAGTTTNHIARRAGVSIGSLYEYFPGKDAILVALVERHLDEATRELAAELRSLRAPGVPLAAVVRRLVETMVRLHAQDPGLHRVLFEEAPLPRALRTRVADLERRLAAELVTLLEAHGLARRDADVAARLSVDVLESLTHRMVLHDPAPGADRDEATRRHVGEITALLRRYLEGKIGGEARGHG